MTTPPVTPSVQTGTVDSGLAVVLQAISQTQTAMASDVAGMRTDMARVMTKLETAEAARSDFETRLRIIEQRPSTVDLAADVKGLMKFRYTVAGAAVVGGAFAGWFGQWAAQHVH